MSKALHVMHEQMIDGSIRHGEFTSHLWTESCRNPLVASRHSHPPNDCDTMSPPPLPTSTTTPVVLVDCMNILFRSHFALKSLTTADGIPTGTYHGFFLAVHQLITKIGWRLVFCWDGGIPGPGTQRQPNWRFRFLPSYKETRKHTEDSTIVFQQMPEVLRILTLLGFPCVGIPGLEADDIFGILIGENPNEHMELFSTDRDFYQLLGPNVRVTKPGKAGGTDWTRVSAKGVETEYGISIEDWPKYLALGGDSSDNIRPVAGWGPETAKKLVALGTDPSKSFEENPSSVRESKYGEKLRANWSAVRASYISALIPRYLYDQRIIRYTDRIHRWPLATYQGPAVHPNRNERLSEFTRFCADHELVTILSKRRDFFRKESNGL